MRKARRRTFLSGSARRRARTDELSFGVSRLRTDISAAFDKGGRDAALAYLVDTLTLSKAAAEQVVDYLFRARAALGALPTHDTLVMERFFDESGGTQLIIHTPFGSRINRAWGLALRKRFCRKFNFELQAAATEDAIVLSLSTSHSFPLEEVARYLHSNSAEHVLVQALLDAPLFGVRWRWNATTALALPRFSGGKKVPPQLQRMKSEDLLATVFPDQVACAENLVGEREIPDHPLVKQTLEDCLHEAMDSEGLLGVLRGLESGAITMVARDLATPSPLAAEVLSAAPYAFLDDAPLEERRTQAVQSRRWNEAESADDLGRLDPEAIASVREEAWPEARSADEMHEALVQLGAITLDEVRDNAGWAKLLSALSADARATRLSHEGRVVVGRRGTPACMAGHPAHRRHDTRDRGTRRIRGAGMDIRIRARRYRPRTPRRTRTRARHRPCHLSRDSGGRRRTGTGFAGERRLRDARPLLARHLRGGMVRTPSASRASIAIPSDACAGKSNRSHRATSSASCSTGNT